VKMLFCCTNAIRRPSGDQLGSSPTPNLRRCPPSTSATYSRSPRWFGPVCSSRTNAIRLPSGDQANALSCVVPVTPPVAPVRSNTARPSASARPTSAGPPQLGDFVQGPRSANTPLSLTPPPPPTTPPTPPTPHPAPPTPT